MSNTSTSSSASAHVGWVCMAGGNVTANGLSKCKNIPSMLRGHHITRYHGVDDYETVLERLETVADNYIKKLRNFWFNFNSILKINWFKNGYI